MQKGIKLFGLALTLAFQVNTALAETAEVKNSPSPQTLTLEQALRVAEQQSPTMRKVTLSRERSRQTLNAQKAATKAHFSLNLDPLQYSNNLNFDDRYSSWYSYEYLSSSGSLSISQPIVATNTTLTLSNVFGWQQSFSDYMGTAASDQSFVNDLYISLRQPLFTYNAQKMTIKQLELDVEQSNISYALAKLTQEQYVSSLFYSVYMSQLQLDIAGEELKNTQQSRNIVADKVKEGMMANVELYQADLNLATARSTIKNRQVSLENALIRFKQFVGMDLDTPILVLASIESNDTLQIDLSKAVKRGLDARMELRQRKIDVEYQQFNLTQVKEYNDLDGSIALSLGLKGNNGALQRVYDKPSKSPSIGISFSVPLYDWGERKARIKAQEASLRSSQIDLETERIGIRVEIEEIVRNIENFRSQIDIERQNQRNAELAYDISMEKYTNGDLTSMDLNLYQSQLSNRRIALVQAKINFKQALLSLKVATLFDLEQQQPVVALK